MSIDPSSVTQTFQDLSPTDQTQVLQQIVPQLSSDQQQAVRDSMMPTSSRDRTRIWLTLLIGLFIMGGLAILCTFALILNGKTAESAALVAVATAVVTGTVGIFAQSPTSQG